MGSSGIMTTVSTVGVVKVWAVVPDVMIPPSTASLVRSATWTPTCVRTLTSARVTRINQEVSGICDVEHADYTECFYCENSPSGNTCKPGCLYDGGSNKVPSCPVAPSPHCTDDHKCEAEGGHQ